MSISRHKFRMCNWHTKMENSEADTAEASQFVLCEAESERDASL